jgi:DNA-binding GntR family transcriptional regulator
MIIITPDIVKNFVQLKVCSESNNRKTIAEHRKILQMISGKNPEGAVLAMEEHLNDIKSFEYSA